MDLVGLLFYPFVLLPNPEIYILQPCNLILLTLQHPLLSLFFPSLLTLLKLHPILPLSPHHSIPTLSIPYKKLMPIHHLRPPLGHLLKPIQVQLPYER